MMESLSRPGNPHVFFCHTGCVVQCVDGVVDYDTYCPVDPKDVCVEASQSFMRQECQLDFDSDNEFNGQGKSLKQIWNETLARWWEDEGVKHIFEGPVMADGAFSFIDRTMIM